MNVQDQNYLVELNNKVKHLIRKELSSKPFPFKEVKNVDIKDLKDIMNNILIHSSLTSLKVDENIYKQLIDGNYNLFNVSYILNRLLDISPKELGLSPIEYYNLVIKAREMGKVFAKYAEPIQNRIKEKYQEIANKYQEEQEKNSNNSKSDNGISLN